MTKHRFPLQLCPWKPLGFTMLESLIMLGLITVFTVVVVAAWRKTVSVDSAGTPPATESDASPSTQRPTDSTDQNPGTGG